MLAETPEAVPGYGLKPGRTVQWADGGVVTAVGWTGQWAASASRVEGPIRMKVGLPHLKARLRPGESVRSSRILQVRWSNRRLGATE